MITASNLSEISGTRHLFFTSKGGVSTGIYKSLNCGPGSNDDLENIIDNRARAMAGLGVEPEALLTVHQHHSPDVVHVTEPWTLEDLPKADGMVTTELGIALGVLAADCAPVLFADQDGRVIGACHSGWKGALGGVIDSTVSLMVDLGARHDRIAAAVGPCIGQKSYEVGPEFRSSFMESAIGNSRFFKEGNAEGKFLFDLAGYVRYRLEEAGVQSVDVLGLDTYSEPDRFFSYRRTTHQNEPDYGRQLSAIVLEE